MDAPRSNDRLSANNHKYLHSHNLRESGTRNLGDLFCLALPARGFLLLQEAKMSSKQYREFAKECLHWAEESASEDDRRHFIDMAKAWVQAAAELRDLDHHVESAPRAARRRKVVNGRNVRANT